MDKQPQVDVCLILEGTYPYVKGGVSSWVHQIISHFQDRTFSIIYLSSQYENELECRFDIPDNVIDIHVYNIFDQSRLRSKKQRWLQGKQQMMSNVEALHTVLQQGKCPLSFTDSHVEQLLNYCETGKADKYFSLFASFTGWQYIVDNYQQDCPDYPFVEYFWSLSAMHIPLFNLIDIAARTNSTRMIHSVSTGYAGFLASMLSKRWQVPFILSEHGIYTKERQIDLSKMLPSELLDKLPRDMLHYTLEYPQQLWAKYFQHLGQVTYHRANKVISLYDGNQKRQVRDGAAIEKTQIISNGIDVAAYKPLRNHRSATPPPVVGLIGRVVPIKDIKTFIQSIKVLTASHPDIEGWIVGPCDEDENYFEECQVLVKTLAIENHVKFLGFQKLHDILPKLGVMVLTSISEAQPLVILEAMAAGLPSVATDVGGCRSLIEGDSDEDKALGVAGRICAIANPEATASAVRQLLFNMDNWQQAQAIGFQRVEKFYDQSLMFDHYAKLYADALTERAKIDYQLA